MKKYQADFILMIHLYPNREKLVRKSDKTTPRCVYFNDLSCEMIMRNGAFMRELQAL